MNDFFYRHQRLFDLRLRLRSRRALEQAVRDQYNLIVDLEQQIEDRPQV